MEALLSFCIKVLLLSHIVRSANIEARVDPLVLIDQGLVRGIRSESDFSSFLGIPYAQVNSSNPFSPALPAPLFEDTFQAYDEQVSCPQTDNSYDSPTTLDCLRLNIYVPNEANSRNPLPVLVWIHGGAFIVGKAGDYLPWPLVEHGIVLVTINYRLGPYGFMCLNTPAVPGNQGLKDQVLALRWIKQNIAAFGGNPDRITIAGESAGSLSVNHHMYYSQPEEQLFHQAIIQSGTVMTRLLPNDESGAIRLAEQLGFNTPSTDLALEFLSNTPSELVTAAAAQLGVAYGPCVEHTVSSDSYVITNPLTATFPRTSIPVIIGVTSFEYGYRWSYPNSFRDGIDSRFDFNEEEFERSTDIVQHFYAGDANDGELLETKLRQFQTDANQNYPMEREVAKMIDQNVGPVYSYVFEYVSENDAGDRSTMQAPHTAELKYLFSYGQDGRGNFNEEEEEIADRISTLWANFVREGNPTPESSALTWPVVSAAARPHLRIGLRPRIEHRFQHANVAFWELFLKTYGDRLRMLQY